MIIGTASRTGSRYRRPMPPLSRSGPRISIRSFRHMVIVFALIVAGLTACSASGERSTSRGPQSTTPSTESTTTSTGAVPAADWSACPGGDCAYVTVPLDHDDPAGDTIDIALLRASRADPDERIGSLLLNPGG